MGFDMSDIPVTQSAVSIEERAARSNHAGAVLWFTGLPGPGTSTLPCSTERRLLDRGGTPLLVDGDTLRAGLNSDLDFCCSTDRTENVRRLAEIAAHLAENGIIAIVAAVSERSADRARAREIARRRFYEIYIAAAAETCERRDPKGLYRQARAGKVTGFTGSGAAYEPPNAPDLRIETEQTDIEVGGDRILELLEAAGVLGSGPDRQVMSPPPMARNVRRTLDSF